MVFYCLQFCIHSDKYDTHVIYSVCISFFFLFMAKFKICFMDFSNLIKLWFNVLIFMIILLGFNLACCICGFRVFIKFGGKITHYVIIYPPSLFLDSNYLNVNLLDIPQLTEGLYYFFKFVPSIFLHSVL